MDDTDVLLAAARKDGFTRIGVWKTQQLKLDSTTDIVVDGYGRLYGVRRDGVGEPVFLMETEPTSHVDVTFAIWTDRLGASEVTELVGVSPTSVSVKGSERSPARVRPPGHGWFVSVDEDRGDPAAMLEGLLVRLEPIFGHLAALRSADPSVELTFSIGVTPFTGRTPLFFEAALLRRVEAIEASLDIDFFAAEA